MVDRVEISWDDLGDLDLDPDNPRHEPGLSRRDIIKYLVERESVLGLAKDIAAHGLSPIDIFGALVAPDGGYVIVEGNRRLCALILLHDPSLAPTKEKRAFERLSRDFDASIINIELTVFKDATEANLWIERKHSGQQGGVGPRSWDAIQQARHYGEKTGNQLALALLDYAIEHGMITDAARNGLITTITRFVSTPFVRQHGLGIQTAAGTANFKFTGTQTLFEKRLKRLLEDIIARDHGATSRSNSADRTKYAQDRLVPLTDDEPTSGDGDEAGEDVGDEDSTENDSPSTEGDEGGSNGDSGESKGTGVHPSKRARLVPEGFSPSFRTERLKRVLAELKGMKKQNPIASALMVRVFIEAITVTYLETRGGKLGLNDKLHIIVHNVVTHIDTERKAGTISLTKAENSALTVLKSNVSQQSYVYSAAYLGLVAHGSAFPEWSALTAAWDEIEAILNYIATNAEPAIVPT
ncbi:hypothetical protein ACLBWV_03710 [Microbacterium paraoxydans]